MMLLVIFIPAIIMIGAVTYSSWMSGQSKEVLACMLGAVTIATVFIPLALILLIGDVFGANLIPLVVRQYLLMPAFLVVAILTLVSAYVYRESY